MKRHGLILIVDDEPSARDTLDAFLFPEGYTLAFAANGAEALASAEELTPDLILLDVMMPDMDGFEICRHLRADAKLSGVHIVMITALDDRASRLRGLEAGADDFLSKPFDSAELLVRVRTVMQLSRYRRLLTEQKRFSWVVEHAQDGYVMLDQQGQVRYANPQARRYLGLSTASELGESAPTTFLAQVTKQYNLEPNAAWRDWPDIAQTDATERAGPRYIVRPESSLAPALWLQAELMDMVEGGERRYLVQLRDVTEDILVRNRMWTFDTHISHKIKTPLGQLTGTLQLLEFDLDDLSKAEIKTEISEASRSAMRLKKRVLDIFQYVDTIDARQANYETCRVADIPAMVDEIKAELALDTLQLTMADIHDHDIGVHLAHPSLALILRELCENAQKFHPEGTPAISISLAEVEAGVRVQVSDDGLTLPYAELERIWSPYYQIEKDVTGEVPGMGLGLAVVASLVWGVGGTCRAYNREGQPGLTFELIVPLAQT